MREAEDHYETIKDDQQNGSNSGAVTDHVHLPESGQDGPRAAAASSTQKTEESKNSGGSANSGSSTGKKSTGSTKDSLQVHYQSGLKQIEERPSLENKSGDQPPETPRMDDSQGELEESAQSDEEEIDQAAFVEVPL